MKISSVIFYSFFALFSTNVLATVSTNVQTASAEAPLRAASYDWQWSGTLKCLYDPGIWPEDECDTDLTFEINGSSLSVQTITKSKSGKETSSAINPGKFQFVHLATNAIAISLESGRDEDDTWVETWSFAMTLTDPDHMTVHWTRIVNNIDLPKNERGSKFSIVGMGELVRMPLANPSFKGNVLKSAP